MTITVRRDAGSTDLPSYAGLVLRLEVRMRGGECGIRAPPFAMNVVVGADRNLVELVEHIEFRERDLVDAVDRRARADDRQIEPAGATRSSGHGSKLVAARAEMLAVLVVELCRKRAAADARRVRLHDRNHS